MGREQKVRSRHGTAIRYSASALEHTRSAYDPTFVAGMFAPLWNQRHKDAALAKSAPHHQFVHCAFSEFGNRDGVVACLAQSLNYGSCTALVAKKFMP
jgi:hypothetical protein